MPSALPVERLLDEIRDVNSELGHENLGFVSRERGVLPAVDPLTALPDSHRAWDELAVQLPELISKQQVHAATAALPELGGDEAALPDRYLRRASSVLANICHGHYWSVVGSPSRPPEHLFLAWQSVCRRLGRPDAGLTSMDILYNWRLRDPRAHDPWRLENIQLLTPISGNQEEDVEYRASLEMMGQATPLIAAIVDSARAIDTDDAGALGEAVRAITDRVLHLAEVPFQKLSLNPHSRTHIDPSIWGKAAGYFSGPIHDGEFGLSGGAYPIFPILDAVVGRASFDSVKGQEAMEGRAWLPVHLRRFIDETARIGIRRYVLERGDSTLTGIFHQLLDAYSGPRGFLGAHRLKAYGFMEVGFKAGRAMTNGGFRSENLFREKTWEQIDEELDQARTERSVKFPAHCFVVKPVVSGGDDSPVTEVCFDISGTGIHFKAGDRCGVLAENDDELVARTVSALRAPADAPIPLDPGWQSAVALRAEYWGQSPTSVPLSDFLRYARIRPVSRALAKQLLALSGNSRLRRIINARATDQWELWDLLEMLVEGGFDPRRLWQSEAWARDALCRVVEPEDFRQYSIASTQEQSSSLLRLVVARLDYRTVGSDLSEERARSGTASSYLHRVARDPDAQVSLRVIRALRFHLPADPNVPVVMFAAGSGFAPFAGFIDERARQSGSENWLFLSLRSETEFHGRELVESHVESGALSARVAFSRQDGMATSGAKNGGARLTLVPRIRCRLDVLMQEEETAKELWELLRPRDQGGKGAVFYVCGKTGFAVSVERALRNVIRRFQGGGDAELWSTWNRLQADNRYLQDIFTTYRPLDDNGNRLYDASELVLHNDPERGQWMVVDGRVYDVSTFLHAHPGGDKIVALSCGMDASRPYQNVDHHKHSEVDSLLGMYEIGRIRRLDFARAGGLTFTPRGVEYITLDDAFRVWVRFLYLIVEMENALAVDLSFMERALTGYERSEDITPFKIQVFVQSLGRFWEQCMANLTGDDLEAVWRVTCGMCSRSQDVRWLRRELEALAASPVAGAADGVNRELRRRLEAWRDSVGSGDIPPNGDIVALCAKVRECARRILCEFKMHMRQGVVLFERHEGRTIEVAAGELLDVLRGVPPVIAGAYEAFAQLLPVARERELEAAERGA